MGMKTPETLEHGADAAKTQTVTGSGVKVAQLRMEGGLWEMVKDREACLSGMLQSMVLQRVGHN